MNFFDCNTMIGQTVIPLPGGTLDAKSMLAEMDHLGIEESLFSHYVFGETDVKEAMNQATLAAARHSGRLVPTWVLDTAPAKTGENVEDQIPRMLDAGLRAARLYPDEGGSAGRCRRTGCVNTTGASRRKRVKGDRKALVPLPATQVASILHDAQLKSGPRRTQKTPQPIPRPLDR